MRCLSPPTSRLNFKLLSAPGSLRALKTGASDLRTPPQVMDAWVWRRSRIARRSSSSSGRAFPPTTARLLTFSSMRRCCDSQAPRRHNRLPGKKRHSPSAFLRQNTGRWAKIASRIESFQGKSLSAACLSHIFSNSASTTARVACTERLRSCGPRFANHAPRVSFSSSNAFSVESRPAFVRFSSAASSSLRLSGSVVCASSSSLPLKCRRLARW